MQKKYIHLIVGLIIIGFSLFYAFRGVSIAELRNAFKSIHYFYLVPALMLVAISYVLRAMRWRYLVCSVKEVKTTDLFSPLMIGFMGNMLPARAGEFIRAYLLSKKEGISFGSSIATIFIERLFDLIIMLLLLVSVLFFIPDAFGDGGTHRLADKAMIFAQLSFFLCLIIFVFSVFLQYKNDWTMKIVSSCIKPLPEKWGLKIVALVRSFTNGLSIIKDKKGFFATVGLSFLIWATLVLTHYPLYFVFGIESKLPIVTSITVLCLTVAIFITIAPTPGFLGSYHLGCVTALHGIFGVQKAVALSYGIVAWFVVIGFTVFVGAIFAVKENISFVQIAASKQAE